MKKCSNCKTKKPDDDFHKDTTKKRGLSSHCRRCKSILGASYYKRYPEQQVKAKERARKRYEANRLACLRVIDPIKRGPCTDCKQTFDPICMDFDHVGEKKNNVASMVGKGSYNIETILEEISKCELVCSNCHRKRTAVRGPWRVFL